MINSGNAVEISIFIVRVFIKLRELISTHKMLAQKLVELERRIEAHDEDIKSIVAAIRQLMSPAGKQKRRIGF